jgi:hypothetical protein
MFPSGAPVSTWDGSFTITFDPTASGVVGPSALDAFSSNLPAGYGPFSYAQLNNNISVGDVCGPGKCGISAGALAAVIFFSVDASGVPSALTTAAISTTSANFIDTKPTVTLVPTPATPLPATLPLFATGLGALGLLRWRRKRKARVSLLGAA